MIHRTPWLKLVKHAQHNWYGEQGGAPWFCAQSVENNFPWSARCTDRLRLCVSTARRGAPTRAIKAEADYMVSMQLWDWFKAVGIREGQRIYWWVESEGDFSRAALASAIRSCGRAARRIRPSRACDAAVARPTPVTTSRVTARRAAAIRGRSPSVTARIPCSWSTCSTRGRSCMKKRRVYVTVELELEPKVKVNNRLLERLGEYAARACESVYTGVSDGVNARSWSAETEVSS